VSEATTTAPEQRRKDQRRRVLGVTAAASALTLATNAGLALSQALRRTPSQILGPFYPVAKPLDRDADLTQVHGRLGRASGQVIEVMGRVINSRGMPVENAGIEIWQANAQGRYTHPSDRSAAALDPHFDGYAALSTDAEGRYRFKTIKPGAYPDSPGTMRAPHIHFDVVGRHNRLVTQLYFAGEPLNDSDRFLGYILWSIQQDVMGWHKPLAWSMAFLAGYGALAVVPCGRHLVQLLRSRDAAASQQQ